MYNWYCDKTKKLIKVEKLWIYQIRVWQSRDFIFLRKLSGSRILVVGWFVGCLVGRWVVRLLEKVSFIRVQEFQLSYV